STPIWWRRARFSSWSAARGCKIEDRLVRSVLREMGISENYEGETTPIRSNISRFSRGTDVRGPIELLARINPKSVDHNQLTPDPSIRKPPPLPVGKRARAKMR